MRRKEKYWSLTNRWKRTKGDGKAKDGRSFRVGRKKETRWKEDVCGMERSEERKEREESERGLPWDNNTQKYWEHGIAAVLWIGPAGVKGDVLPLGCRD